MFKSRGVLTLSKGLEHVASHPCQAVLRRVSWGGPSRGGAYGHGHGAARAVTGGRMRGASGLGLQHKNICDSYTVIIILNLYVQSSTWRWKMMIFFCYESVYFTSVSLETDVYVIL